MSIEELKSRLETAFPPVVCAVDEGTIRRYVQALGDLSPRWQSAVPPTFILTIGFDTILQQLLEASPAATILHGSTELECQRPVAVGDVVVADIEVANIRERKGKLGTTAFITVETVYKNQRQETVARSRQMIITY